MSNWPTSRKRGNNSYSLFLLIGLIASVTFGCATRHTLEAVTGERAQYLFRILYPDTPNPMITWVESPRYIETTLRLGQQQDHCERIEIFANRHPKTPVKLSDSPAGISALDFLSTDEEMLAWKDIPTEKCSFLVTLGTIRQDLFTGISISNHKKVVRRYRTVIQGNLDARPSQLGYLMYAGIWDYIYSPFIVLGGIAGGAASEVPETPVTIVFEFPGQAPMRTTLTRDETTRLLTKYYPHVLSGNTFSGPIVPLEQVRVWTRAALAKLNLEFVEYASGHVSHDEWIPDALGLKMIDGHWGDWKYTVGDHNGLHGNLVEPIRDSNLVRFTLQE